MKKTPDWQPNLELRAKREAARPFPIARHGHNVLAAVRADEEDSGGKWPEERGPSDYIAHVSSSTEFDPKTNILHIYVEGELVARYKLYGIGKLVPMAV